MRVEREYVVTVVVAAIAVLVIVGGFASFSGMAVYQQSLRIDMARSDFNKGDVFDVDLMISPVTFISDDSIVLYLDGEILGVIAIKQYLDDNSIEYGEDTKQLGFETVKIITLKNPLRVNLNEYLELEHVPNTRHVIRAEFSKGDGSAEAIFNVK